LMVYVCESIDGGVSIIYPAKDYEGSEAEWRGLNEIETMDRHLSLYPIQLPIDRYFRDAWEMGEHRIEINLEKAKKIHTDVLRRKRAKRFAQLDVESLRAYESGSEEKLARVIELKEDLRKMPEDPVLNTDNIEDLRDAIPLSLR